MSHPQVSILVPDIHSNILGAATALARHLAPDYTTEIVGPDIMGAGVCPIYEGAFPFKAISTPRIYRWPDYLWESRRLAAAVSGDVIIAMKAFFTTVPVALSLKRKRRAKVMTYLDEWDGALVARLTPAERRRHWRKHFLHPVEDIYCPLVEKMIPQSDRVLSTTTALQNKFGGDIIPFGVDTRHFAPQPAEATAALKTDLGLSGKNTIVFGGVVRPHKGVELILDALLRLGSPDNCLLIVGPENEHVQHLQHSPAYAPYIRAIGPRPPADLPRYLDLATLIVLPLHDDPLAQTQMPCKVFEAMAMAKPIIASHVSDLPRVLDDGCGWTIPPDDPVALAEKIQWVLHHPQDTQAAGHRARQKCINHYSNTIAAQQLKHSVAAVLSHA